MIRWARRLLVLAAMAFALTLLAHRATLAWFDSPPRYDGPTVRECAGVRPPRAFDLAVAAARSQAQALIAERRIPGFAVAIGAKDRIIWSHGFGYSDVETGTLACPATQFRAASVSKVFTAAALGRLVQAHLIDLDESVRRYVPEFPDKGAVVTIRQLAAHRGGIRAYRDDREAIQRLHFVSVLDSLATFKDDELVAPPGKRFVYSNYGYVLLSAALERAARQDFLSLMQSEVFEPLGMIGTGPETSDSASPRATPYDYVTPYSHDGTIQRSPPNDFSGRWASGGFVTTAEDMVRFGTAQTVDGFLDRSTRALLFRPVSGVPGIAGYGLDWLTARDLHGREVHFHFGAGSGSTSFLAVYPDQGIAIAMMGNLGHAKLPFTRLAGIVEPFLSGQ
jgi:CubicO group peptidase (beta-lactamase class C family)